MSNPNQNPGEKVESVLVVSNFFLWFVALELGGADGLIEIFLLITLVSLGIVIFSKQETEIIFRKFVTFFTINLFDVKYR